MSLICKCILKIETVTGCWRRTPVILVTQEAEIRRITVQSQPGQIVHKTLSRKNPSQKMTGGVAQGEGPEFKPQTRKKKERNSVITAQ
jgi:hypothetical protein